ncbi:MAG TPA: S26 family signal peptidase, partial [Gemmatales bacterium]|nr:S26 family signal peptidase [Gemmatales bacterium]
EKLSINDSSFSFQPETSEGLGFGFRCGFLGMLHREIIQQRIERDSGLQLVHTAPNVTYEILKKNGEVVLVDNPQSVPNAGEIEEFREPIVRISFILPAENIGDLMQMCTERRGTYVRTEYLSPKRAILVFDMPLAEVIYDLYDRLKSVTHGYGTMDYDVLGYQPADLVKLDVLVHGNPVDALSTIVHRAFAERRGRALVKKLRSEIDRHQFEIAIQAAIGTRIIARETITALRKNVTAKCYGGDISRKKKLWAKQAEGKKRMKQVGQVEIPQEAFLAVLEAEEGRRRKPMSNEKPAPGRTASLGPGASTTGGLGISPPQDTPLYEEIRDGWRETFETISFVVFLVLMLKAFVAEAYVIPTGSMATTLLGDHMNLTCKRCQQKYAVNASNGGERLEQREGEGGRKFLQLEGCCPNCEHVTSNPAESVDGGDKVLVLKPIYDLFPVERHDTVVFKYPQGPQKDFGAYNYIKRLWGLPGEKLAI